MENETQIRKLYNIARASKTTDEYISYIEYVLQGNSFSAIGLANAIYKAAMIKYETSMRKHANTIINANPNSMSDQLNAVRAFAIRYKLLLDFVIYIERIAMNGENFNMERILSQLIEHAICAYDMRLRRKIDVSTGITIIEGYEDAVQ